MSMTKEQRKEYIREWGADCFLCKQPVPFFDRTLVDSIVPLEKYPEHADDTIIHTYMICKECKEQGDLI